ncbi:uncharacterized protein LOC111331015 [Stylophora pistillata]|nr:uncharacterized protein LOC111331015 [Stylophora pistillata]
MLNLHLEEHGKELVSYSNRSHDLQIQQLVATQTSLPFLDLNQRSSAIIEQTFTDHELSARLYKDWVSLGKANVHVENFSADHPGIMYSTVTNLAQTDLKGSSWGTCGALKSNFFMPRKGKEALCRCKLCYNFREGYANRKSNAARVMKDMESALSDIPPFLLYDLFQESNALETTRFQYDTFLGNCLSCHSSETNDQGLLMYPSGPGLDVLNLLLISVDPTNPLFEGKEIGSASFTSVLSKQQFAIHGQIRQTDFSTYSQSDIIVGVRSQYNCSFFQSSPSACRDGLSIEPLETLALSKQAMCIAVSPYIPGEAITVTETGEVYLWSCGHPLQTVHQPNSPTCNSQELPWYQCVFATNPRCIALADAKGMNLLDFRAGKLFQRLFFSIPSSEVDPFECVSAIQRHPQNTHHYVLATDQSLLLIDDRFLQHPVLKWRHHNEDPVQFINVNCDTIQGCNDTVLVISGSNHRQTHCFQYSEGQSQAGDVLPLTKEECYLPPQSTTLPWKVSSYSEWYYKGLRNGLTFSSASALRLSKPLIGICTLSHTTHPQKGFTVFQMSSVGDLFYQPFVLQSGKDSIVDFSSNNEGATIVAGDLGPRDKILCQKWIDLANVQNENFVKSSVNQVECIEVDTKVLCDEVALLPEPHSCCVLCNNKQILDTMLLEQTESGSNVCKRCGMELTCSLNLVKNQKNKRVLTKETLCMQFQVKELGIFPDMATATDPLSKCLWLNWTSFEAIPVFSSVEQGSEKNETEERSKKGNTVPPPAVTVFKSKDLSHPVRQSSEGDGTFPTTSVQKQDTPSSPQPKQVKKHLKVKGKQTRHVMGF